MSWKQPTPTDINQNKNLTFIDRSVFREVLSMCRNEDGVLNFSHAKRNYDVELKRGQCILKVNSASADVIGGRKKILKSLKKVSKWYTKLHIKGMPFGTVVTVINYDAIIKMDNNLDNRRTIEAQQKHNRGTANKSVKSVKNEKKDIHAAIYKTYKERICGGAHLTPKAKDKIETRLKIFSEADLLKAIDNFSKDKWRMEHNSDRGVAWFFHSDDRIDQFLNLKPSDTTPDWKKPL